MSLKSGCAQRCQNPVAGLLNPCYANLFAQFSLGGVCTLYTTVHVSTCWRCKSFSHILYRIRFQTLSLILYFTRRSLRRLKTRIIQLVSFKKYIFYSKLALIRLQARGESSPWLWASTAFCFYSVKQKTFYIIYNHRDTYLEQQQTDKIETEVRDVDRIRIT